jgi:hypothetical protein
VSPRDVSDGRGGTWAGAALDDGLRPILGVVEPGLPDREPGEAANVAGTRLVEPVARDGQPVDVIAAVADERDVDEVGVVATPGDLATAGEPPGSTVVAHLARDRWPVTVRPSPAP